MTTTYDPTIVYSLHRILSTYNPEMALSDVKTFSVVLSDVNVLENVRR